MSPMLVFRRNIHGACPYCESMDFHDLEQLRPDRTTMQCNGCLGYSVRHSNGFQYPLEGRMSRTSAPAIVVHEE